MRRLTGDDGAVALLVAFLGAALIGLAALVVDVAALYTERRELQNGADAAALEVARRCATGPCGDAAVARTLAAANARDGAAAVESLTVTGARAKVVVRSQDRSGGDAFRLVLAPVLGLDGSVVRASSTASWGAPSAGPAIIPLVFSWCAFAAQTGGGIPSTSAVRVIRYQDQSGTGCTGPSGKAIPGGFGWLQPSSGACSATARTVDAQTVGKPGSSPPGTCAASDFVALQGRTVLLPLYDQAGGTGSSGWYHVYGFAAFRISGYRFSGEPPFNWNSSPECSGDVRCIKGYFLQFVSLDTRFEPGGPDLGGRVVRLVA